MKKKNIDDLPPTESEDLREDYPQDINVQFVGKMFTRDKKTGEPVKEIIRTPEHIPTFRVNGGKKIELPSGEEQLKGFYHPDAVFLKRAYPDQFKTPKKKG